MDCEELIPIEHIVDFDFEPNPFEQISRAATAAPFILFIHFSATFGLHVNLLLSGCHQAVCTAFSTKQKHVWIHF